MLDEYEDYLPLTIRQIFYRLVGAHNYEKTEHAYARLCEHLNRARRARIIPMASIRDDGGVISAPDSWDSVEQFMRTNRAMAADFTLDRSAGQKTRLVVDCEAVGMVPQLERVAHPLGVTVISSGGFDRQPKGIGSPLGLPITIVRPRCWISAITMHPAHISSW